MTLSEKVAYIKGLADGMDLDESKKEVRLMLAIIDALEETALSVEDLEDAVDSVTDELDSVSSDLADVEEIVYDEDSDFCGCDDDVYEAKCPKCGEILEIGDDEFEKGYVECKACGEKLEFDDCDDDCDCCD